MPKKNSPARGTGRNFDPTARPASKSRFAKGGKSASAGGAGRGGKPARAPRTDGDTRPERAGRPERFVRPDAGSRPVREGRADRAERPFRGDRTERPARGDRDARPAREGRFDRDGGSAARAPHRGRPGSEGRGHTPRTTSGTSWSPRKHEPNRTREVERREAFVPPEDVVLERLEAMSITAGDVDGATFGGLGLGKNIVEALSALGAASPFPIQAATIPNVLEGRDVLGRGRTGSGKTIAFGAPLVERLLVANSGRKRTQGRSPRALILAPTRELAMQINRTIMPIAKSVGLFTTTIVGGMPQGPQVMSIRRGVDIVIATPGRLEDLQRRGLLSLDDIDIVVLDEADHMCDLGFLEPVQRILRSLQGDVQHLLFSATLDKGVGAIIDEFLENPAVHEVAGEDQASSTIDHHVLLIDHHDKIAILTHLLRGDVKAIVFARTRAFTDQLADELDDAGIDAIAIHGDLTQAKRARALERFGNDRARVLVATDVAARGIHVDDVDIVIQADAPDEYKTYLHRSGRTGRAGKHGTVVTLVPHRRARKMKEMLDRAEIDAKTTAVKPGDRHLDNLV